LAGTGFCAAVGGSPIAGGLKVKVKPLGGKTVALSVQKLLLAVPALVLVQSVEVVRLLKSALELPLKPTWIAALATEVTAVKDP